MALSRGYITSKQTWIWDLKKKGLPEAAIARKLEVTRQTVHKAITVANSKIAEALMETAKLSKIKVESINSATGILIGYSSALETQVVVTFSASNGVRIWYRHEGDCRNCDQLEECQNVLLVEMEDRNIRLQEDVQSLSPCKLAELLFQRIMEK